MTASGPLTLVLTNAKVLTMERRQPSAQAVGVREDTIVYVGSREEASRLASTDTRVVDCQGMTPVLPRDAAGSARRKPATSTETVLPARSSSTGDSWCLQIAAVERATRRCYGF